MAIDTFIELPIDLDDVNEKQVGPEGEYTLVIDSIKETTNDMGHTKGLLVVCVIEQAPAGVNPEDLENVLHNISLPLPEDDPQKVKNKALFIKRFCHLFGIKWQGGRLNPQDFPGKRAKVHLIQDNYNDRLSNKIRLPNIR